MTKLAGLHWGPEHDAELAAPFERLIALVCREPVTNMRTTSPEGCTWAAVVGLHTMMSGIWAVGPTAPVA